MNLFKHYFFKIPNMVLFITVLFFYQPLYSRSDDFQIIKADNDKTKNDKNKEETHVVIEVVAQKRKQNIQEIPASVSVLNGKEIEDRGVKSTEDISSYVPNFSSYHCHDFFSFYSIRGQSNLINSSNAVGIYIDDVPASIGSNQTTTSLYEIKRIEIIRGPQGNLYGLNSAGGIVNIITKQPDNFFTAKAKAGYGSYNAQSYTVSASGPIVSDVLYAGLNGLYKRSNSFIEEENDPDRHGSFACGRAQIRWLPVANCDILFTIAVSRHDATYNDWAVIDADPYKISDKGLSEKMYQLITAKSLRVKYSYKGIDFTSITAQMSKDFDGTGGNDFVSTQNNSYTEKEEKSGCFLEEIRISTNDPGSGTQWLLGMFYFYGKDDGAFSQYVDTNPPNNNYIVRNGNDTDLTKKTASIFGQYGHTFFKKFTLTGGLRYDRDEKEIDCDYTSMGSQGDYNGKTAWDSISPRIVADVKINKSVLTYISMAKGFKAGGYSTFSTATTADDARFDPEYTWSYEAGVKTSWLGNRLFVNMAFFYSSIEDLQIMTVDSSSNTQVYSNAAGAAIYGSELELTARHFRGFDLSISGGLLQSEINEHEVSEYEGNTIPLAPEWQGAVSAQYMFKNGIFLRGEYNIYGKTYHNEANTYMQDTYSIVNAKCGYKGEYVTIHVYGNNLFNKEYYTYTRSAGTIDLGVPGAPRMFGAEVQAEF